MKRFYTGGLNVITHSISFFRSHLLYAKMALLFLLCLAFAGTAFITVDAGRGKTADKAANMAADAGVNKAGEKSGREKAFSDAERPLRAPTPTPTPFCTPNGGPPSAGDDLFTFAAPDFALEVAAPGALVNDSDGDSVIRPVNFLQGQLFGDTTDPYLGPYFVVNNFVALDSFGAFTYGDPSGEHPVFVAASTIFPTYDRAVYRLQDNADALFCPTLFATAQISVIYFPQYTNEDAGETQSCPDKRPDPQDSEAASSGRPSMGGPNAAGRPVNIATGNVYLNQTDYVQPNVGGRLALSRSYNSFGQTQGIFGYGWTTEYDERIETFSQTHTENTFTDLDGIFVVRLRMPDGKLVYFWRASTSDSTFQTLSKGFYGSLTVSGGAYTLTFKDGTIHSFNSSGRLTAMTDRNGNAITLTYRSDHTTLLSVANDFGKTLTFDRSTLNQITVSDDLGSIATYAINSGDGTLTSVTFPDGSEFNYTYTVTTSAGLTYALLTEVTDTLGHTIEKHTYDGSYRALTSEGDGGVEAYAISYDSDTQTTVTDARDNDTVYTLARKGSRKVVTSIAGDCGCGGGGTTQSWIYDSNLNVTKYTDGNSHETNYTYDANGNMLTKVNAVSGTKTYTYNAYGQALTAEDEMGGTTTFTYDADGNATEINDPLSETWDFTYNGHGQVTDVENARGKHTAVSWTSGNPTRFIDALSNRTDFAYDARSRMTSKQDALSQETTFEYDLNNRVNVVTFPDSSYVQYTYDTGGRRTDFTDARGKTTSFDYDDNNRLIGVTDPLSHVTSFGYDDMSNLTSTTDANSNTTSYDYDGLNRLKKITNPAPAPSATPLHEDLTYDDAGNLKTRTDTAGRETAYDYDNINRLTKVTDPMSNETHFTYNARSQMTKVTDALSQEYDFTYNALGRQLTQTRNGTTMTFTYDEVGNRATRTDHNGVETDYTYDDLNRLTNIAYSGSANFATYGYDEISQLTSAENQVGTVTFSYDSRNRVSSSTDVFSHITDYTYDENGNRLSLSLDSNPYTTYAYDDASRLISQTDDASHDYTFTYDDGNRLVAKTLPNGVESVYTYDGMNRLKELKHHISTSVLVDDQYTYNTASQISQIADLSQTRDFTYDDLDRLTGVSVSSTPVESYGYDEVGNRTSSHLHSHYNYDPFNRQTSTNIFDYTYDSNGNRDSKSDYQPPVGPIVANLYPFNWDEENRLTSVITNPALGLDTDDQLIFEYDALGRRVKRTGAVETKYVYDGLNVVMDDAVSGTATYQNGPGIDNKLKMFKGVDSYFLADHLGSTVMLTNSSAHSAADNTYDSFGNPSNTSFPTRFQFTGREFDSASGLYDYRARQYDPQVGRFISEDPIGFAGGDVNLYGYVKNRPLISKDPLGQDIWGVSFGVSGGAGGGDGIAGSYSSLYGISGPGLYGGEWDLGAAGSGGLYTGPGHKCKTCKEEDKGTVIGQSLGVSAGVFLSNAGGFPHLRGPFNSTFVGLPPTPFIPVPWGFQIDRGSSPVDGSPVASFQVGYAPGKGWTPFYANYTTCTEEGTLRDFINQFSREFGAQFGMHY